MFIVLKDKSRLYKLWGVASSFIAHTRAWKQSTGSIVTEPACIPRFWVHIYNLALIRKQVLFNLSSIYKTHTYILIWNFSTYHRFIKHIHIYLYGIYNINVVFNVSFTRFNYSYFYDKTGSPYIYHKKGDYYEYHKCSVLYYKNYIKTYFAQTIVIVVNRCCDVSNVTSSEISMG